ncbi:hypothetical protein SAMN05444338_1147 [Flavobacterium degerlachei]|uniref:Uncharacterized protein n=1 Tax=Flavobacterium degerlachei TaxID=229203 RepID=A0A1H3E1A7_9FLAO|nr:hypothetical protein SAMN05444338_1147 [Flavobacterium degerlachei]
MNGLHCSFQFPRMILVNDQGHYLFLFQAGVLAVFFYANQFVLELVKLFADGLQHSNALPVTLPCNALCALWVDTQPLVFGFHTLYGFDSL